MKRKSVTLKKSRKRKVTTKHDHPFLCHLPNDKSKIKYLFYLRQLFPTIFQNATIYQIDPLQLVEKAQELLDKLSQTTNFKTLLQKKHDLLSLAISQRHKKLVSSTKLSPKALKEYRGRLCLRADKLVDNKLGKLSLVERISELRNTKVSLSELTDLVQVFILVQQSDGKIPDSRIKVKAILKKVGEPQLDYFTDQVTLERKVAPLELILGKRTIYLVKELIKDRMKKLLSKTVTTTKSIKMGLTLEEWPAFMALFRGCLGQDCSSQYSSVYALSPVERIFSIKGKSGPEECKGYVAGTMVQVGGRPALYVHTIAGPRVTGAEAKLILDGLYLNRKSLGVEAIILPSKRQLEDLVNYLDIKNTFNTLIASGKQRKIQYLDGPIRKKIESYVPADITYDYPEANRMGYLFVPSEDQLDDLDISLIIPLNYPSWNTPTLSLRQKDLLIQDFLKLGMKGQSKRISVAFKGDLKG